jgi:hypothetical protein
VPKHVEQGATAGGDLAGSTYPNPVVASLQGVVISGTPSSTQVLTATSPTAAHWAAPTGGGAVSSLTTTGSGAATLASGVLNIPTPGTATFTSLTTTGTAGAATLASGILNIPQYTPPTVTSLTTTGSGAATLTSGVLNVPTPAAPTFTSLTTTGSGAATLASGVLNIPTPGSSFITSITTTGTSGAATVASGVLNIPQYSGGGGSYTAGTGLTLTGSQFSLTSPVSTANGGTGVTNGFAGDTLHVLRAGDTMTGALTAPRFYLNSTAYSDGGTAGILALTGNTTSTSGALYLNNLAINAYTAVCTALAPNLTTGQNAQFRIGVALGSDKAAEMNYVYSTTVGSSQLKFQMYGSTLSAITYNQAGDVTIGRILKTSASATTNAALNIPSGVAPTTPNAGDIWYDGTHLQFRGSAATYQLDQQTGGGGGGTVTSASVVSANGFTGTVATATTTPAITLTTSITGVLKGNGTAILAATAGTDYQVPISLTTTGSGAATFASGVLNIPTTATTATTATSAYSPIGTTEDTQGFTYPTFRQNLRGTISPTSGELTLYCFTAGVSRAITKLGLSVGATAAAGVTYCALGLYTVNTTTGAMTLVASTPNTTTAAAAAYTPYQIGLTATYSLVAGTRYAVGFLMLATTMPVMNAAAGSDDYGNNNFVSGVQNRLLGQITGETTLPATIADSAIGANGNAVHVLMIM